MTLINSKINIPHRITAINAPKKLTRRLFDLGFTKGGTITLLQIAPGGGTYLILLRGVKLALRQTAAEAIIVEPL